MNKKNMMIIKKKRKLYVCMKNMKYMQVRILFLKL